MCEVREAAEWQVAHVALEPVDGVEQLELLAVAPRYLERIGVDVEAHDTATHETARDR